MSGWGMYLSRNVPVNQSRHNKKDFRNQSTILVLLMLNFAMVNNLSKIQCLEMRGLTNIETEGFGMFCLLSFL